MSKSNKTSSAQLLIELSVTTQLCELVDSPRSLAVFLLLNHGEYGQYLELQTDPNDYDSVSAFADDYLVTEVLKKSPNLPTGVDRRKVALEAFKASEQCCRETNARFSLPDTVHPVWAFEVQREFRSILGGLPQWDIDGLNFRHGPGATTACGKVGSVRSEKYTEAVHLTANLIPFYKAILGDLWHSCQRKPGIVVQGNRFTTVPKNAKTDRGICTEPTLNMYVQLGIGQLIRRRLKRFKVDLDSQVKNQSLARRAYGDNLATIDLKAASDSVSWKLVQYLCTPRWAHLFALARSPACTIDGETFDLQKISSMGNGFTFELESTIFLACMRVAVPRSEWSRTSVYGDDIIVPRQYAPVLIDMLNYFGFSVNGRKSFLAGNFFESCGHDYFKGINVRPFYLKGSKPAIPYCLQIANALRLYAKRRGVTCCDSRFRPLWTSVVRRIPRRWRSCRVPEILGDTGLITSKNECNQLVKPTGGAEGYMVRSIMIKPVMRETRTFGQHLASIAAISGSLRIATLVGCHGKKFIPVYVPDRAGALKGRETVRGFLGEIRTKTTMVQSWPCGLAWDDKS